jgi:hypothetical protein
MRGSSTARGSGWHSLVKGCFAARGKMRGSLPVLHDHPRLAADHRVNALNTRVSPWTAMHLRRPQRQPRTAADSCARPHPPRFCSTRSSGTVRAPCYPCRFARR